MFDMEHTPTSQIGPVVDRRRLEADLTQRELSDLTGIPLATLNRRLARGDFKVSEIGSIATALGVSASHLMAEAEQVSA